MDPLCISLGFLIAFALFVVFLGSLRLCRAVLKNDTKEMMKEDLALAMPILGSVTLFWLYVILRFVPIEYFNYAFSILISIASIFSLGSFLRAYIKPQIATGAFCVGLGFYYFYSRNWIANNVLAIASAVCSIEKIPVNNFLTSFSMLTGLFLYDIFWVYGSDVMLTVATSVDGPIKLLFPRDILGDRTKMTLLGLGDLVVPGLFISQTLIFSRHCVKRGNLYFVVALIAYTLSLLHTMIVLVRYQHGQPALLFIVPWLLTTFLLTALLKGDIKSVISFDLDSTFKRSKRRKGSLSKENELSLLSFLVTETLDLFGLNTKQNKNQRYKLKSKEA